MWAEGRSNQKKEGKKLQGRETTIVCDSSMLSKKVINEEIRIRSKFNSSLFSLKENTCWLSISEYGLKQNLCIFRVSCGRYDDVN